MRYAIVVAALAALGTALPQPYLVTVTQIVDVYVTVTATPGILGDIHNGHHKGTPAYTSAPATTPTSTEVTAPEQPTSVVSPAPPAADTPAPPASSAAPPSQPTGTEAAPSGSYSDTVLSSHNVHRANHSAPNIVWSQDLANIAQEIADSCSYGHNMTAGGGGYGQNIAAGPGTNQIDVVITNLWYNSEVSKFTPGDYGQPTPPDFDQIFEEYGHFTQVVWVGSTSVGCATVDCSNKGLANVASDVPPIFHVCNYGPPGNYIGEFGQNVLPSKGDATVYAAS